MNQKPKKILITWNGQPLKYVYPYATRWQVFKYKARKFFNRVLIVTAALSILSAVGASSYAFGKIATASKVIEVPADDSAVPVLERIAKCESGGNQYDSTGQVLMHWNKNGTVDVGKYAINNVWFKQASKLGLDLTKPEDNKAMAVWIYHNKGTADWYASQACWMK